ncbi:MAG TPA: hypothetical protein VFZ32_17265 [Micromonosporaceae bacterium]
MRDWPVVVTNRCAEACANEFGLSRREIARAWLYDLIEKRGRLDNQPPSELPGLSSPSGYFLVAGGAVALPLAPASDGTARWVAVDCRVLPSYREKFGTAQREVDPLPLRGAALLRHVNLTRAAVARFQRLCGADPNPDIAREELREILVEDARAVTESPDWCRKAPDADCYLVSGDEFLLPLRRRSALAFDALGLIHRASSLFTLRGPDLALRCRYLESALPEGSQRRELLETALHTSGQLSWRRPGWAKPHPRAQFWVRLSPMLAAPVAWQPERDARPLLLLDLVHRQSLFARLTGRARPIRAVLESQSRPRR